MNATKRSAAWAGWVVCSALVAAVTGCRTHVVHERTRTVYVPAPPAVVHVPPDPAPPAVVHVHETTAPQPAAPVVVTPPPTQSPVVVIQSENDFYEPLAPHGRWVVVGSYGRCWIPARVDAGWRPYSNGYWQRTDAGWYWVSEEPWGWATYHYGRWDFHTAHGWIWVPHTQWAPAWVCWREGGGYVGWAPLRPSVSINVSIGRVDYEPAFASRAFVFVEHRRMLEPVRPKTVIVNNTTIINQTVNITNVKVVNKTVINEGPRLEVIERASGRKVRAVPVHEFRHREETTVAARERNIPTASGRNIQPPARTEARPDSRQPGPPREAHVAEKPAEIQKPSAVVPAPEQPLAPVARPTSPQIGAGRPARDENKPEAEVAKHLRTMPPTRAPEAKPEVKAARSAPAQRELRPLEKSAVTAKPTPQPVTPNPDVASGTKPTTTPPTVTLKRPEARSTRVVPVQNEAGPVEKPAVTMKPTRPQPVTTNPTRDEKKAEAAIERKPATIPIAVPTVKPEVRPAPAVAAQREHRPSTRSAVTAQPAPQPVTTNPIRGEAKREVMSERRTPATPPAGDPDTRKEVKRVTKPETKPAAKVETMPLTPARIQNAAPTGRPAARQPASPGRSASSPGQSEPDTNKKHEAAPRSR